MLLLRSFQGIYTARRICILLILALTCRHTYASTNLFASLSNPFFGGIIGTSQRYDEENTTTTPGKMDSYLRATTIVTNANTKHSELQCWEFTLPFSRSTAPGLAGALSLQLANVSQVQYTSIPPKLNGGLHNAPVPQVVLFFSGLANITLPHSSTYVEVPGGADGLIVALDVTGDGHNTDYPSDQVTNALALPLKDGKLPAHRVINEKEPCPRGSQIVNA